MGTQRSSPEFKQGSVEELLAGAKRPSQLCREHGLDFSTPRTWREQYAQQGIGAWTEPRRPSSTSEDGRIAELERVVGHLTVENMVLKRPCSRRGLSPRPAHPHHRVERPGARAPAVRHPRRQPRLGLLHPG